MTLSIQPSTWSNEWWGSYSNSKYILMMECFKTTHDAIAKTQANQVKIRTYYTQYKREHGPLYGDDDESSTEISFPLNS